MGDAARMPADLQGSDSTEDSTDESSGVDGPSPRKRRTRRLSLTGAILAMLAGWMTTTPSLVPRSWAVQLLLTGVCMAVVYGVGAFLGWAYRTLELPVIPSRVRRVMWQVVAVLMPLGLLVAGWLGRNWQLDQQLLLGMPEDVPMVWVLAPLLSLLLAALLLAIARGIRWVGVRLYGLLGRRLRIPGRLAATIAVALTALLTWYVVSGLLVSNLLTAADAAFALSNDDNKPGVENPESVYRSGGPNSVVSWESIGREGRQFIWQGRTAAQIAEVTGDPEAAEPVRAFIGLEAADTVTERSALAVEELRALGGFDRSVLAVAGTTGSGWIDPKTAAALEFAAHGDVATVTTQYSYLPSWLSFLMDQERAQANAEELLTAIRVELDTMPPNSRPELYVYGESLGAFSTGSAFTSVEDMSTTTDGALLLGPPSFDETWQRLQENREPGSPLWRPLYQDGALARVASSPEQITDPSLTWQTDNRIVYLVNSSDPIVAWTADRSAWLDPRGDDVPPQAQALPVIGFLQASVDLFAANGAPPGHGHIYGDTSATAWSEILGPPSLSESEIEAIETALVDIHDP
jgi:uncharacterized membrane protein